jgi:hypothetical protein
MFAGMNAALTEICADYTDAELNVIARFLTQTADAGRAAAEELPASPLPDPEPALLRDGSRRGAVMSA